MKKQKSKVLWLFEQWNKLSKDNKFSLVLVVIAAMLTIMGNLFINWLETPIPVQELATKPVSQALKMELSGFDVTGNDIHIINFKPPNNVFTGTLINRGDTPLEFLDQSFPKEFFYLTLWDSDFKIPADDKLLFKIIFKNKVPDGVEYPFKLTYNNKRDKVEMLIRISDDWNAHLQNQLDQQINKSNAINANPQQSYMVAKGILAQNNNDLSAGLKEALVGQFLALAKQPQAAAIAYFNAEQTAPTVVERFVNTSPVIKALAKIYKTKGDHKKAEKWYNIAAKQGDIEARNNLTTPDNTVLPQAPTVSYVDKLTEYIENGGKFTFTLYENPEDQKCGIKSGSGYLGNFVAGETYTTFYVSSTTTWVTKGPLQAKPQCGLYSSKDDKNLLRFNKNEKKMNMWVSHFRFDEDGFLYYGDDNVRIGEINEF